MDPKQPQPERLSKTTLQRKTTLKWSSNGELSSIDMARILDKLKNPDLTQCDLTCSTDASSGDQNNA